VWENCYVQTVEVGEANNNHSRLNPEIALKMNKISVPALF
jgi:hypothetical protein